MREAVIVSTARTPIGKAYRGAFNNLEGPTMGAAVVKAAVERAGVEAGEVEDCVIGCALQQGTTGFNAARQIAIAAGLPVGLSELRHSADAESTNIQATATARASVRNIAGDPLQASSG